MIGAVEAVYMVVRIIGKVGVHLIEIAPLKKILMIIVERDIENESLSNNLSPNFGALAKGRLE